VCVVSSGQARRRWAGWKVDGRRRVGDEGDVHGLLRRLEAPSRISSVTQPPGVLAPRRPRCTRAMRICSPVARLSALAARKGHRPEAPVQGDGKPARIAGALALLRGACSESTECACHLRPCRPPAVPRPCAGERPAAPSAGGPIAHGSHPETSAPRAGSPARPSGVARPRARARPAPNRIVAGGPRGWPSGRRVRRAGPARAEAIVPGINPEGLAPATARERPPAAHTAHSPRRPRGGASGFGTYAAQARGDGRLAAGRQ
jgi:hypothetical protein